MEKKKKNHDILLFMSSGNEYFARNKIFVVYM